MFPEIVEAVYRDSLTYLDRRALKDLFDLVQAVDLRERDGVLLEIGCASGGSAIVMTAAKSTQRELYVYDTFGMIPAPTEMDGPDVHARYARIVSRTSRGIGNRPYYGYDSNLLATVSSNFSRHGLSAGSNNVHLVQGNIHDSLNITAPVLMAHIDCDWFSSVECSLQRIAPHLVPGGTMIIDDFQTWSGCRKAVRAFMEVNNGQFRMVQKSRLHLVKNSS